MRSETGPTRACDCTDRDRGAKSRRRDRVHTQEQKKKEEEEDREDVTKRADLSDFYRNLYSRNVAFGAKPEPERERASEHSPVQEAGPGVSDQHAGPGGEAEDERGEMRPPVSDREEAAEEAVAGTVAASALGGEGRGEGGESREGGGQEGSGGGDAAEGRKESREEKEARMRAELGKRRNDDGAVMSARERYLARKKARVAGGGE